MRRRLRGHPAVIALVRALEAADAEWNDDGSHPLTAEIETALALGREALGEEEPVLSAQHAETDNGEVAAGARSPNAEVAIRELTETLIKKSAPT